MEITCFHVTEENVLQPFGGWILSFKIGKVLRNYGGIWITDKLNDQWTVNGHENTKAPVMLGTISGLD